MSVRSVLAGCIVAGLLLGSAYASCARLFAANVASLVWAALLLLSFVGYGQLVAFLAATRPRPDWGLAAAWGMAVFLGMTGPLMALGVLNRAVLVAVVVLGLCVFAADVEREVLGERRRIAALPRFLRIHAALLFALGVVFGFASLHAIGALGAKELWHTSDDAPAYFVFPKQLLQTGRFEQPFSMRALVSLGGQSVLQASLLAAAPIRNIHLFDRGLCLFVVLGLVLGQARKLQRRALVIAALLFVLTLPNVRINSASTMSGAVLFLGLVRTIEYWQDSESERERTWSALFAGVMAAAACTLRQTYVIPAAGTLLLSYALPVVGASPVKRRDLLRDLCVSATASLGFLLPWLWCSYRTFRTPIFPILNGTYRLGSRLEAPYHGELRIHHIWESINLDAPVKVAPLFFFAALLVRDIEPRRPLRALFVASCLGYFGMVWKAYLDVWAYARYAFAFEIACILAFLAYALRWRSTARGVHYSALAFLSALALHAYASRADVTRAYDDLLTSASSFRTADPADSADAIYSDAQLKLPLGAGVLAMVDEPFRFDYSRNRIYILDFPGFVSPDRELPTASADEFVHYLREHRLRYFAFISSMRSSSLYNSQGWERESQHANSDHQLMAPYFLNMFRTTRELVQRYQSVYASPEVTVLDLEQPRS